MPMSNRTTPVVLQAFAQAFRKFAQVKDRYTITVTNKAHATAIDADSVAVNAPDKIPPKIMTTTKRPGNAAKKAIKTTDHPGNLP